MYYKHKYKLLKNTFDKISEVDSSVYDSDNNDGIVNNTNEKGKKSPFDTDDGFLNKFKDFKFDDEPLLNEKETQQPKKKVYESMWPTITLEETEEVVSEFMNTSEYISIMESKGRGDTSGKLFTKFLTFYNQQYAPAHKLFNNGVTIDMFTDTLNYLQSSEVEDEEEEGEEEEDGKGEEGEFYDIHKITDHDDKNQVRGLDQTTLNISDDCYASFIDADD
jgi:hypothetical protein